MNRVTLDRVVKWLSVATVYVVLVSYGVNVAYYSGYLAEFGINIRDINYWPSLTDFATNNVIYITSILAGALIFIISMLLINFVARHIVKKGWRFIGAIAEGFITSKRYIYASTVVVVAVLTVVTIYHVAVNAGMHDAIDREGFARVNELSNDTANALLIYQNANVGVVKFYDKHAHKFLDGYILVDLVGDSFKYSSLR